MDLIRITRENLEREHICCAISDNRDCQVSAKKAWLADRLDEGLVFLKGDVRGKCFIEYLPAEAAWAPVDAPGYTYIDCLWVSGQFKGQEHSNELLDSCIRDSRQQGKLGLVTLSSKKKRGFLSDPAYLRHKGFLPADSAPPYFELMALPLVPGAPMPRFSPLVKDPTGAVSGREWTLFYTHQCPFTAKYVPLLEQAAARRGAALDSVRIVSREQAQAAPTPFSTFTLFYEGKFVTHEIPSEKKFEKMLDELKL